MRTITRSPVLSLVLAALTLFAGQTRAQMSPVRVSVTKNEKSDQKTTYQDSSGYFRQQQIKKTVSYTVEVRNFSAGALPNLTIKWAVLYDPTKAEAHGGGSVSWSTKDLKVLEGEHTCTLDLGQECGFDTAPIDLSSVHSGTANTTQGYQYGGGIRGYCVEVFAGERLLGSELQPQDIKSQIEAAKTNKDKGQ